MPKTSDSTAPHIHRLTIERFRGIEKLIWYPEDGTNIILGGGDVGKTSVLDAIALLLHPANTMSLVDTDYWHREVENGFRIEAVMTLPEESSINQQSKQSWPWAWDGEKPVVPNSEVSPLFTASMKPVYRLQVRGTADFDLVFEIVQPDETVDYLTVGLRRRIGLVRLGGDDRNDRDLRLIQGSALDRLLSDKSLRARLGAKLAESDFEGELLDEAKIRLKALTVAFEKQALPGELGLGLTGGQGVSLNALIGLTAVKDGIELPVATWGAGTRRLAALEIAAIHQGENPIVLVDEVERGLEPYRQRSLISKLQDSQSQVFLTTHSAAAISAGTNSKLWYLDNKGIIGRIPATSAVIAHQNYDPETFLARIALIVEGKTEVGFVTALLKRSLGNELLKYGIWITDAEGHDNVLSLLEGLVSSRLSFGGFTDNEGRSPSKWAAIRKELGNLLFQWDQGCLEENIISLLPEEQLEEFIKDASDDLTGYRLRTLQERLDIAAKDFQSIKAASPDLKTLIIQAATGKVPETKKDADKAEQKALKSHAQSWFKSFEGGEELVVKIFQFNLWPELKDQLLPFINAVRDGISLPEVEDIT